MSSTSKMLFIGNYFSEKEKFIEKKRQEARKACIALFNKVGEADKAYAEQQKRCFHFVKGLGCYDTFSDEIERKENMDLLDKLGKEVNVATENYYKCLNQFPP